MASPKSDPNKRLNLAIVGCGFISSNVHLPVLSKLGNINLVAICDTNINRAQEVAERFKIRSIYQSFTGMLENEAIDVVDILTPPNTHANLAEQALRRGCHCLIEKPLALSVADADKLLDLAEEKNLSIRVIHNYSFLPCMRKARAIVSSGVLGKIIDVDIRYITPIEMERYLDKSHWVHSLPGGVFSDIAPHLAMLLLDFLEGVFDVDVMTKKNTVYPHLLADELKVTVNAKDALGSFTLSFGSACFRFTIDIVGSTGGLYVDADTNTVIYHKSLNTQSQLRGNTAKGMRALSDIYQRFSSLSTNTRQMLFKSKVSSESHAYLIGLSLQDILNLEKAPVSLKKCRDVVSILERTYSLIPSNNSAR